MSRTPSLITERPADGERSWLEPLKGIAIVWIFLNHLAERMFGAPYIANPSYDWPPLADRFRQLYPIGGGVWYGPLLDAVRWIGWIGDDGVQLFLIASGFGLTWGLLSRAPETLRVGDFYRRRLWRILPTWWAAHLMFMTLGYLLGRGMSPVDVKTWLSFFGIRFTPDLFYYFSASWWYIGLTLQLYLAYPLLWALLRRSGALLFLIFAVLVGFEARLAYATVPPHWLDPWLRGAVFVTRLPEFAFGMALAAWLRPAPAPRERWLASPASAGIGLMLLLAGLASALTWLGNVPSAFLLGTGAFLLLFPFLRRMGPGPGWLRWFGRHSFAVFLVHHPLIDRFVPRGLARGPLRIALGVAAAIGLTVVLSLLLERGVAWVDGTLRRWWRQRGAVVTLARVTALAASLAASPRGAELNWRARDPRELPGSGWGERPALLPDSSLGWRLIPSRTTRLRWEGYDYVVTSNALGFPGGDLPASRPPGSLRILVTGDAFSSAEGVDTGDAWPALLEAELARRLPGRLVQVANAAITGYGPNQYAAAVRTLAPVLGPDLVIVEFFINDFQDVMVSDSAFRASIGFEAPDPKRPGSILRLENLSTQWRHDVMDPLRERLVGRPRPYGYHLVGFRWLERGAVTDEAAGRLTRRLSEIREAAALQGAPVIALLVPAAAQVCGPAALDFMPRNVSLDDTTRFDPRAPARRLREIASGLDIPLLELEPALRAGDCPYQSRNMHWTEAGHVRVAGYLADTLSNWIMGRAALAGAGGAPGPVPNPGGTR